VLNTIRGLKTEKEHRILYVSSLIDPFHRDHEVLLGQGHADGASQPSSYSGNDRVAHVWCSSESLICKAVMLLVIK
jgi:hypothetical protein